jgi:hypothetical protein
MPRPERTLSRPKALEHFTSKCARCANPMLIPRAVRGSHKSVPCRAGDESAPSRPGSPALPGRTVRPSCGRSPARLPSAVGPATDARAYQGDQLARPRARVQVRDRGELLDADLTDLAPIGEMDEGVGHRHVSLALHSRVRRGHPGVATARAYRVRPSRPVRRRLRRQASRVFRRSARRSASAVRLSVGVAQPPVAKTLLPAMCRLAVPNSWQLASTTPWLGSLAIRVVPM